MPLATLIKWFPDKRGMITGLAVAGFGAGALVTAPIAERLLATVGIPETFAILGVGYLIAVTGAALFMKEPPVGYVPQGLDAAGGAPPGGIAGRSHLERSAAQLAVVCALADPVPQHHRRHLDRFRRRRRWRRR